MNNIKYICVFGATDLGRNSAYMVMTKELSFAMIRRNIGLIFGGGTTGLMKMVAEMFVECNRKPIGILPREYIDKGIGKSEYMTTIITSSRTTRLETMIEMADGFITLPGSFGTIQELITVLNYIYMGIIHKPCAVLNVASFYEYLIEFFKHCMEEEFLDRVYKDILISSDNPEYILDAFENYVPSLYKKEWK